MDRPVLITGSPRAGKSLVARLFAEAPEFFWLGEPKEVWDIGLGRRGHDRRTADDATPAVRDAIVAECERYLGSSGRARYVDELARHALRIPFLFSVLPNARLILVVRHPARAVPEMMAGWQHRDTVRRRMRRGSRFDFRTTPNLLWRFAINYLRVRTLGRRATWGPRPPGLSRYARTHNTAEIAASQWAALHEMALDDLSRVAPDQWLLVRHEDLLGGVASEAVRLARFAEISDVAGFVSAAERIIDPCHTPSRTIEPSDHEWEAIRHIVAPVAEQLGYGGWSSGADGGVLRLGETTA